MIREVSYLNRPRPYEADGSLPGACGKTCAIFLEDGSFKTRVTVLCDRYVGHVAHCGPWKIDIDCADTPEEAAARRPAAEVPVRKIEDLRWFHTVGTGISGVCGKGDGHAQACWLCGRTITEGRFLSTGIGPEDKYAVLCHGCHQELLDKYGSEMLATTLMEA